MKEKLQQLYDLKLVIESKAFQDNIIKPLYKELEKIKDAYDCKTMNELAIMKGRKQGLTAMIKILKGIDNDIKNLKYEIEQSDSK